MKTKSKVKGNGNSVCIGAQTIAKRKIARGQASMQLYVCSKCSAFVTGYLDATDKHAPRYCPSCGARFKETNHD